VQDYEKPAGRAEVPKASRRDFLNHYSQWRNFKVLFGCAWSWFALDVAFYVSRLLFCYLDAPAVEVSQNLPRVLA
jgi:hypothetical protein